MNFKKLMARISAGTAFAALVLSAGLVFSSTANAQAPMTVFGEAAASDTVGILVDGKACKNASIKADSGSSTCLLYTSPSPRDGLLSRMPSSA